MVKKGKKRASEGSEGSVKPQINPEQPAKKLKIKKDVIVSNGSSSQTQNPKKEKKNVKLQEQSTEKKKTKITQNNKLEGKKPIQVKKEVVSAEKKKDKEAVSAEEKKDKVLEVVQKRLEAKQKKNELRKKSRQENGQYKPSNIKLNVEQIKERIQTLGSQPQLSRTARRKLAALKKKLKIEEGTFTPTPPVPKMKASTKRKLRRHKAALLRGEKIKAIEGATDVEKHKNLEEKAKKVSKLVKQAQDTDKKVAVKNKQVNKNDQKKQGKNQNITEKQKKTVESESDDDDDDDEEEEDETDSENVDSTLNTSAEVECDDDNDDDEDDDEDDENDDNKEDEEDENEEINADSTLNTSIEAVSQDDDSDNDDDDDNDDEEEIKEPEPPKKIKKSTDNVKSVKVEKNTQQKQASEKKTRYVLYVANLPYTATVDDIKKHFLTKVTEVCSVRIPQDPKTNKTRGFAYVEFTTATDYEKGLSLHQSDLQGRRINVQYTQSGSKNAGKKPEIVAKNQKLHALRKQGKLAGSVKESNKRSIRRNKQKRQGA